MIYQRHNQGTGTLPKQIMLHYPLLAQIKLNIITAKCDQAVLTNI